MCLIHAKPDFMTPDLSSSIMAVMWRIKSDAHLPSVFRHFPATFGRTFFGFSAFFEAHCHQLSPMKRYLAISGAASR